MDEPLSGPEMAAWGGFLSAYARLDQAIDADLREHDGITHVEFEVLLRLRYAEGRRMRIADLARASLLTRSGISRLVARLTQAGLVSREAASEDGRGSYATLTEAGAATFDRAAPRHLQLVRTLFHSRLSPAEVDTLGEIWHKILAD